MRHSIRFEVSEERYAEIMAYVAAKKRWRKAGDFARDACFQMIERNPVRNHGVGGKDRGAALHERQEGQE